jgi:hypothetical protein
MSRTSHEQNHCHWKHGLDAIFRRIGSVALGEGAWFVMRAGTRVTLAFPGDREAARVVLGMYQPHRLPGRLFRFLVQFVMATGLWRLVPRVLLIGSGQPQVSWLQEAARYGKIGFLGCNPVHGPRCIISGVDPNNGSPFVAKLGMDASAASVVREHELLELLHGRYEGVLPSLGLDRGADWALMRLPHLGVDIPPSILDPLVEKMLGQWLRKETVMLGESCFARKLLDQVYPYQAPPRWHERMSKLSIRSALVHGDFAVWNTRYVIDGSGPPSDRLIALDWEWANEQGVAGIDIAHGLRQEAYLVRRMSAKEAVEWMLHQITRAPWNRYLQESGWDGNLEDWLRLGLLHSHFNALNPSRELLAVLGIELNS